MKLTPEQKTAAFEWLCANLPRPSESELERMYCDYWLDICARAGADISGKDSHIVELEQRVAELSKDKERLDWMIEKDINNRGCIIYEHGIYEYWGAEGETERECIDAAIAKEQERE